VVILISFVFKHKKYEKWDIKKQFIEDSKITVKYGILILIEHLK
jgi:hypothetical protein